MSKSAESKLRAVETVLIAALSFEGEFTKWDLAVVAWRLDPEKFGMRGYEDMHPDMNRVLMEIVGSKRSNPIRRGYMQRVDVSTFRLSALGRSVAVSLADKKETEELFDAVCFFVRHQVFRTWQSRPEEPSCVGDVFAFLGLPADESATYARNRLACLRTNVLAAMEFCSQRKIEFLARRRKCGELADPAPIHFQDLSDLMDFLAAMEARFFQPRSTKARAS